MRLWSGLALLALLTALAGCGGDDGPSGAPQQDSASGSASASPGSPSGASDAGDVEKLFETALKPLIGQQVIDFRHDVYSGQALAIETKGRAFQQVGWQATTTSPKVLGSPQAPSGDDVKGTLEVRAVADEVFMQLSSWQGPLAGCWLRTNQGQVPGGQLAMTPGVPGYVTLLGAIRPSAVLDQDGGKVVIGADVPLRIALQLLTTGVLGLLQLDASQLDGADVPLGVQVTDGVVSAVELKGGDLVGAVREAGGDVTADGEATLGQLRITVTYRPGPADAPPVTAPAADLVMSNADVQAQKGCRGQG
jgi:hypothetical protein